MKSLSEMTVRISGVGLVGMSVLVGIGTGVRVLVGGKVNVGWMFISVGLGFAHAPKKSVHGTSTRIIPIIRDLNDLLFTGLFP